MSESPLISFIVTIYNLENYLKECVDSIMSQEQVDFEIILVNDGSIDSSIDICREYAEQNSRVKVIDQENTGSGGARNSGLLAAAGKYIIFVDGDDFLVKNSIKFISEAIEGNNDVDVLLGRILYYYAETGSYEEPYGEYDIKQIYGKDSITVLKYMFTEVGRFWSVCNHVFKREFLLKNELFFKPGEHLEDFRLVPEIILKASSFGVVQAPFYVYRRNRPGAKTGNRSSQRILTWYKICSEWIQKIQDNRLIDDDTSRILINKFVDMYIGAFSWNVIRHDRKKVYDYIKNNISVLGQSDMPKARWVKTCVILFGVRVTISLMKSRVYIKKVFNRKEGFVK